MTRTLHLQKTRRDELTNDSTADLHRLLFAARAGLSLPEGEGWGEGEDRVQIDYVRKFRRALIALVLLILFLPGHASAETLRVTTWNLQEARGSAVTNAIGAAATALKEIDPDVILLQQVRDWPMCLQLVQALKPAVYNVLVCSRFNQPASAAAGNVQAAILSKRKAYFSWSEAWRTQDEKKAL